MPQCVMNLYHANSIHWKTQNIYKFEKVIDALPKGHQRKHKISCNIVEEHLNFGIMVIFTLKAEGGPTPSFDTDNKLITN